MRNLIRKAGSAPRLYMLFLKIKSIKGKNYLLGLCAAGLICYNIFSCVVFERLKNDSREATYSFIKLV